jgi:hypothetical protein
MRRDRFGAYLKWLCDYKLYFPDAPIASFDDGYRLDLQLCVDLHQRVFQRWLRDQDRRSKRMRDE